MEVRNPRTGQIDYRFTSSSPHDLSAAVARARRAHAVWAKAPLAERIAALTQFARELEERSEPIVAALTVDTGRHAGSADELDGVVGTIAHFCARAPQVLPARAPEPTGVPGVAAFEMKTSYAVAGFIAPWNYPLLMCFLDAVPAVLCGCTVLIKPSEVTPRFVAPLRAAIAAVPALSDVVQFVEGGPDVGDLLVRAVDVVCFTGSVKTGRRVAGAAADRLIPCHLELGGKDPALVFEDAPLARTARALCFGATANAGQSCLSIERAYVHRSIFEPFVEAVVDDMSHLTLNLEDPSTGDLGPLILERQAEVIERHIADAIERGARVLCGGKRIERGGFWFEPTVLCDVTHDMLIMREETFGPVLPMMPFEDEEGAVELANDSAFGLSGAVFSADEVRARRVADALAVGAVSVNDVGLTAFTHAGAKHAFGQSGLGGSRMGDGAFARFFRERVALINGDPIWRPWWSGVGKD